MPDAAHLSSIPWNCLGTSFIMALMSHHSNPFILSEEHCNVLEVIHNMVVPSRLTSYINLLQWQVDSIFVIH
jgi:hypothetical protein